jgi:hypothetical protein
LPGGVHQRKQSVDPADCVRADLQWEEGSRSPRLLQEEPGFIHLGLSYDLPAGDPDPVFLGGQLGGRSDSADHGRWV